MQTSAKTVVRIGDWRVDPDLGQISRPGKTARLEIRAMRLLLCLAEHAGETVSIDDLLSNVWPEVTVTPDSVYQAMASLRRLLGDDPKQPTYIATVPRLGYRLIATVSPWEEPLNSSGVHAGAPELKPRGGDVALRKPRMKTGWLWALGVAACLLLGSGYALRDRLTKTSNPGPGAPGPGAVVAQPQKSIAVLPFLDLTEGMKNEEFADGMTEELIDKLSQIPGLSVPSATSSFYFKNKQVALGEIASKLGVIYVLDGSVRKSGTRLRVAARLVRADNGFVMWSETYDRTVADLLLVQDDIAADVTQALKKSIDVQSGQESAP